jgi:hypothetical protein
MVGTCLVVNSDGWVLTAAHLFTLGILALERKVEARRDHSAKVAEVRASGGHTKEIAKRLRALGQPDADSPTNMSTWWGNDKWRWTEVHVDEVADIAVVRLSGFDPKQVPTYPVFKAAKPGTPLPKGTSLCRVGYPFAELDTSFDDSRGAFIFDPTGRLVPFPIEGILTREVAKNATDGPILIETSSPGLMGQSGGPIFDVGGVVWSVQSKTNSYYLGFNPVNPEKNKEYQYMNAGLGAHPSRIAALLTAKGVVFSTA